MSARIIDGKEIARSIRGELKEDCVELKKEGFIPCLAVILVGEDPASLSYVKAKERALEEVGMLGRDIRLKADIAEEELLALIAELNNDDNVDGILVQLPLPRHIDESKVIRAISPEKDVDCFHPVSIGALVLGEKAFLPCTPHGILVLLKRMGVKTDGAHVVVVGRSNIVGKPLANLLIRREVNATLTVCHTGTKDLSRHTKEADILIAAAGRPELISASMIKKGAVVIDVGVNRVEDADAPRGYRLKGDVNFEEAKEVASMITPVPGGVGPMTIAMLLTNVLEAALARRGRNN